MIAQDTGSAIVGPARADLYSGAGDDAARIAGRIRHPGRFVMLLPRELDMVEAGHHMPLPVAKPKIPDAEIKKELVHSGPEAGRAGEGARTRKSRRQVGPYRLRSRSESGRRQAAAPQADRGGAHAVGLVHALGCAAPAPAGARDCAASGGNAGEDQARNSPASAVTREGTAAQAAPRLEPLDRRLKQRLARGREPIEARIDLHGRTQDKAHATLLRFLRKARTMVSGLSWSLPAKARGRATNGANAACSSARCRCG